jgi:hypothetical protein
MGFTMKKSSLKISLLILLSITLNSCGSLVCSNDRPVQVFKTQQLKINKDIIINKENKLFVKSPTKPTFTYTNDVLENKIEIRGIQTAAVSGYHTDECSAHKDNDNSFYTKPSVSYKIERKGDAIYVETTGEWQYIYHHISFSRIDILLPQNMKYQYIETKIPHKEKMSLPM